VIILFLNKGIKSIECSIKFLLKVGVKESIVNTPRISSLSLTSQFALFVFLIMQTDEWCVHNRLFNANIEEKFKQTPISFTYHKSHCSFSGSATKGPKIFDSKTIKKKEFLKFKNM
jgi:hypothetical protein